MIFYKMIYRQPSAKMSLERRNLRFDFEIRKTRSDHSLCEQSVNEILCNIHAMYGMQIHKQGFAYIWAILS